MSYEEAEIILQRQYKGNTTFSHGQSICYEPQLRPSAPMIQKTANNNGKVVKTQRKGNEKPGLHVNKKLKLQSIDISQKEVQDFLLDINPLPIKKLSTPQSLIRNDLTPITLTTESSTLIQPTPVPSAVQNSFTTTQTSLLSTNLTYTVPQGTQIVSEAENSPINDNSDPTLLLPTNQIYTVTQTTPLESAKENSSKNIDAPSSSSSSVLSTTQNLCLTTASQQFPSAQVNFSSKSINSTQAQITSNVSSLNFAPINAQYTISGQQEQTASQTIPFDDSFQLHKEILNNHGVQNPSLTEILSKLNTIEDNQKKYYASVKGEIRQLTIKVNELSTFVSAKRSLTAKPDFLTYSKLSKKYKDEFEFPIKDSDNFTKFENRIADKDFYDDLKQHLTLTLNVKDDLTYIIRSILKKFTSKEVLKNYTTSRSVPGKLLFNKTSFYSVIEEAIRFCCDEEEVDRPNEQNLWRAIGTIITGSKDWDGGRMEREKKGKNKQNEI